MEDCPEVEILQLRAQNAGHIFPVVWCAIIGMEREVRNPLSMVLGKKRWHSRQA